MPRPFCTSAQPGKLSCARQIGGSASIRDINRQSLEGGIGYGRENPGDGKSGEGYAGEPILPILARARSRSLLLFLWSLGSTLCVRFSSSTHLLTTRLSVFLVGQAVNMLFNTAFTTVALLAAEAAAHGAVTSYKIAGKDYPGYVFMIISYGLEADRMPKIPRLLSRQFQRCDPVAME